MAELTTLESKLGEVVGLAMAAQEATQKVMKLPELEDDLAQKLERMHEEAAEAERRGTEIASNREGKKTAILEEARQTKSKAQGDADDVPRRGVRRARRLRVPDDGGGRRGRPLVGARDAQSAGAGRGHPRLRRVGLPIQQRHFQDVQLASTQLASEKDPQEVE